MATMTTIQHSRAIVLAQLFPPSMQPEGEGEWLISPQVLSLLIYALCLFAYGQTNRQTG